MAVSNPYIATALLSGVQRCATGRPIVRFLARAVVIAGISVAATLPAAAQDLSRGWWVVVGAFPTEPPQRQRADVMRMNAAAGRCSLRLFNDFSGKFRGFNPGVNVFVIGAYASRARAQAMQTLARPCFPDAYVKYGEYLGE
ncbi:MAG: SPOR domain-containing protein [Hyphomicrobiales bacterium]|nr:SPOR domain-containing protein [Hyphomicrobiales bacterium]